MDPEEALARERKRPAPWDADKWLKAIANASKYPRYTMYQAICLGPDTLFQTAEDVQNFLELDYMPETYEAPFSYEPYPDTSKDDMPLIKYCDIRYGSYTKLGQVVEVKKWGMVLINGQMVWAYGVSPKQPKSEKKEST